MDLGLDKLIELFEERFGRRASTFLLLLVAVGVAAFSIHAIITYLIRPILIFGGSVIAYFYGAPFALTNAQIAQFLIQGAGTLFVAGMCYLVVSLLLHRIDRRADLLQKKLSTTIDNWEELQNKLEENAYRLIREYLNQRGIEVEPMRRIADGSPTDPAIAEDVASKER